MSKPVTNLPEWADASNGGNYTGGPFAGQPRKVSIPSGIAAEGFRPGADDPTAAEHINDYLNQASKWIRWVFEGTTLPVASRTIVERDAFGTIAAQRGDFFASVTGTGTSLNAQSPTTSGSAVTLYAEAPNSDELLVMTHDNDGAGITFSGGPFLLATCNGNNISGVDLTTTGDSATAVIVSTLGDGSDGLDITTSGASADGIRVTCNGASVFAFRGQVYEATAVAVYGHGGNDGQGARFFGGTNSGIGCSVESYGTNGLVATGGNSSTTAAVKATGKLDAPGVIAIGGPTSGGHGVVATGGAGGGRGLVATGTGGQHGAVVVGGDNGTDSTTTSDSGYGVHGKTSNTANATARGVRGVGFGAGTGVEGAALGAGDGGLFTSSSGAGGLLVSSSGAGGDLRSTSGNGARFTAAGAKPTTVHVVRAADPSSHEDGGMWYLDNVGLKIRREGVTRHLYDTAGGMAFAFAGPAAGIVSNIPTVILTASFAGANLPAVVGTVIIRVVVEVGRRVGNTANATIEVFDDTYGSAVDVQEDASLYQPGGLTVFERMLVYDIPYTLPAPGARTFLLTLSGTSDSLNYRHASMTVVGVY